MLPGPMRFDPGLMRLATCDANELPRKYQAEKAGSILNWVRCLVPPDEAITWLSFRQFWLLCQQHS